MIHGGSWMDRRFLLSIGDRHHPLGRFEGNLYKTEVNTSNGRLIATYICFLTFTVKSPSKAAYLFGENAE
jgi:hypothetical protein